MLCLSSFRFRLPGWLNNGIMNHLISLQKPLDCDIHLSDFSEQCRQDLIIWFTWETDYLGMCQPLPFFINHQKPYTTKYWTINWNGHLCGWTLSRSNHSPDEPNCAHMLLPMLDLRLDGSKRIRPAVIEDHLNKGRTMTTSKITALTIVLSLSWDWLC